MAKRQNYKRDAARAEAKIHKLAGSICKIATPLRDFEFTALNALKSGRTECERAEASVALWEAVATDVNSILMAAVNIASEVNTGLQAAYAVRADEEVKAKLLQVAVDEESARSKLK